MPRLHTLLPLYRLCGNLRFFGLCFRGSLPVFCYFFWGVSLSDFFAVFWVFRCLGFVLLFWNCVAILNFFVVLGLFRCFDAVLGLFRCLGVFRCFGFVLLSRICIYVLDLYRCLREYVDWYIRLWRFLIWNFYFADFDKMNMP